jgi:hypothetical protein
MLYSLLSEETVGAHMPLYWRDQPQRLRDSIAPIWAFDRQLEVFFASRLAARPSLNLLAAAQSQLQAIEFAFGDAVRAPPVLCLNVPVWTPEKGAEIWKRSWTDWLYLIGERQDRSPLSVVVLPALQPPFDSNGSNACSLC